MLYVLKLNVLIIVDIKWFILCYKNGFELLFLNLIIECIEIGCYVIYYNEWLNGVVYFLGYEIENVFIEICEVIVYG